MSNDLIMSHEDLELTVLELMERGEDILAIGVWEAPCKRLAMKQEARKVGNGYRITDKGSARLKGEEMKLPSEMRIATKNPDPEWIVSVVAGEPESLIVLHRNLMAVSGYEALVARRVPITHGKMNDASSAWLSGSKEDLDAFLRAMLDAAWARGLRPANE